MTGRLLTGLVLVALGVLFLLGELGVVAAPGQIVADWWPIVLVALGAGLAIEQRRVGAGPLVFLVLGLLLLSMTTDLLALEARVVWPIVLIGVGVWLIARPAVEARTATGRGEAHGSVTAVFEDRTLRSSREPFRGAAVTSLFGDVTVDLREAQPGEDMSLDLTGIFGDFEITVPAGWRVDLSASGLFADIDHHPPTEAPAGDAPTLQIRGFSLFGDVTVRH